MFDLMDDKKYIHTFGQIKVARVINYPPRNEETGKYRPVMGLEIMNPLEGIHKYKRNSISILDYLANIASLGMSLFSGFCKVFTLIYSKHFDNYKIIDNLLSKQFIKQYEFNNLENISNSENNDKQTKNNERIFSNEDLIINDVDEKTEYILENEDDKMVTKLPKLTFFDFIFNNVYSNCCGYIKRQKLIDSCDEILYRYYSIENILYNQILFEHLIKDYKWNNPEMKSIHKNQFIKNLKKI